MLQALSGEAPPADLIAAVYAETEGNPFFVEEVFQHLSEEGRLFDDDGHWRSDLASRISTSQKASASLSASVSSD